MVTLFMGGFEVGCDALSENVPPNTLVLEYLGPSLMGLFAEAWKLWPCQSKDVSRDGLCGFRGFPKASSAWCMRFKK